MNKQNPETDTTIAVSILIVTYNSAETIVGCVESVISELKTTDGELIIIDNKSSDGTPQILESLATKYPDLIIELNRVNTGFAAGNNQALKLSKGEQVLVLNPDTILELGVVSGLMQELLKDEKLGLVAPQLQFPNKSVQKTCRRFPKHMDVIYNIFGLSYLFPQNAHFNGWKMGDFDHASRQQVDQPAGAALMLRGDIFRKLGGFDLNFPMFFNDVDLCKRVKDAGYEIWYLPEYKIVHLGGVSVKQAKVKMTVSSHVSFFRYFEKHFTRIHQQPMNFTAGVLLYLSLIPRILLLLVFKGRLGRDRDTL